MYHEPFDFPLHLQGRTRDVPGFVLGELGGDMEDGVAVIVYAAEEILPQPLLLEDHKNMWLTVLNCHMQNILAL